MSSHTRATLTYPSSQTHVGYCTTDSKTNVRECLAIDGNFDLQRTEFDELITLRGNFYIRLAVKLSARGGERVQGFADCVQMTKAWL